MAGFEHSPEHDRPQLYIDENAVTHEQAEQLRNLEERIFSNPLDAQTRLQDEADRENEESSSILQFLISPKGNRAVSFDESTESGYDNEPSVIALFDQKRAEKNAALAKELAKQLRVKRIAYYIGRVTAYKTALAPEIDSQPDDASHTESHHPVVA